MVYEVVDLRASTQDPGAQLTYFNDGRGGGGGVRVTILGLKFWPKEIFWDYERCRDFFESRKKTEGFFGLQKKDYGIFWGVLKNLVIFLGRQILKL